MKSKDSVFDHVPLTARVFLASFLPNLIFINLVLVVGGLVVTFLVCGEKYAGSNSVWGLAPSSY